LVGEVVSKVAHEKPGVYTKEETAKALSVIAGAVLLVLGLLRLGWLIEFIPYVPISAFVTAASVTIMSTQFPVVMGITGIATREAPYKVIISTLKHLDRTKLDASIGLSSIALLFTLKYLLGQLEVRQPARRKLWETLSSLRLTFTMLLFTFISWLVHRKVPKGQSKFRIVGVIESGKSHNQTNV
jgi:sodium-independent sulfate anion transporter 11